jgi:type I restriction enzyme M protein
MAEFSVISGSEISGAARWDAEFFSPTPINLVATLHRLGCQPLGDFIAKAQRGLAPAYDVTGLVPVIRTVNVREIEFSDARQEYVTQDFFDATPKGKIGHLDIAVTSTGVGTLGRVFCNLGTQDLFADGHITVLTPKQNVNYAYLTTVLQSSVGQIQFEQWQRGSSGQIEIYPDDILQIMIPRLSTSVQSEIASLWRAAVDLVQRARTFYPEAEQELLERMGWSALQKAKPELYFVERATTMTSAARADAEHYQPKYRRLREHLNKLGAMRVGNFCSLPNRGVQPLFVPDGEVFVLASKAIRPQGVAPDDDARTSKDFWLEPANEKARVKFGDVLLNSTGVGTLGRASFYLDDTPAVADNHVAILRPNESICLPVYLSLFLNSPAGIAQSEMFQTGSSGQLEIYPQHIQEISVFLPRNKNGSIDLAWQKKLADKVIGASTAKQEAQAKLAEAKGMVEKAVVGAGVAVAA